MRNLTIVNRFEGPADYVNALSLSGTTAKTFTVPATAQYMVITGTVAYYYKHTDSAGTPTAVAPAGDVTDGTASIYVPIYSVGERLKVTPGDKVSVVTAAGGTVTARYWRD